MTTFTEGLTSDDNNVCSQWRIYQPFTRYGEVTVVTRFLSRRPAPTGQNCVVIISGGRHSSYRLFKVVLDHGLMPRRGQDTNRRIQIAVSKDGGWVYTEPEPGIQMEMPDGNPRACCWLA
jgi:hypothetical protein